MTSYYDYEAAYRAINPQSRVNDPHLILVRMLDARAQVLCNTARSLSGSGNAMEIRSTEIRDALRTLGALPIMLGDIATELAQLRKVLTPSTPPKGDDDAADMVR